jgi:hypothetical protein
VPSRRAVRVSGVRISSPPRRVLVARRLRNEVLQGSPPSRALQLPSNLGTIPAVMARARVILGAVLACGAFALLANSAFARHRTCGTFREQGTTFSVTVLRGPVKCHTAKHVLRAFFSGKGKQHGPPNGGLLQQWWVVGGWKCGYGAGGGACIRGGKTSRNARNWIQAQER